MAALTSWILIPRMSPTSPRSTAGPRALNWGGSFSAWMTARPEMLTARPPNSLIFAAIIGLMTPSKVDSTIRIDALSVTRRPLTNLALMPASRMRVVIALPPPCTMTGLIPTASRKTTSRRVRSTRCSSSIALPPYLMTKVCPRNCCMKGRASIRASTRAASDAWLIGFTWAGPEGNSARGTDGIERGKRGGSKPVPQNVCAAAAERSGGSGPSNASGRIIPPCSGARNPG